METEEEFCLDEAREMLFTLQRACERHAVALSKVVEALNSKQANDEWLLEVVDEAAKGMAFHQQQLEMFTNFHARTSAYVEEVRNEANQLAIQELGSGGSQPEAVEEGDGGEAFGTPVAVAASVIGGPAAGPRRSSILGSSSKMVHPELVKFKLEKQAKILGKYGGIPALGAGLVLPRAQRDAILKATGSAAAREIHYSKVENKDASNLAEVMRFKVRKSEVPGEGGGTPSPSPWQAELSAKKGKTALDGTDQKDQLTPCTRTHAAYAEELGGVLQQRQAALEEALAAQARPSPAQHSGPVISAAAGDELAEKLRRRQEAAKQMEAAVVAALAEAAEEAAPPTTPTWSNATAPFGGELTAALQRRGEQQRLQASGRGGGEGGPDAAAGTVGLGSGGPDAATAATAPPPPPAAAAAGPAPAGSAGGTGPPTMPAAAAVPAAAAAANPQGQRSSPVLAAPLPTAVPVPAAAAPAAPAAAAFRTSVGATRRGDAPPRASAGTINELQEKLQRRLSVLDVPPQPPPAV